MKPEILCIQESKLQNLDSFYFNKFTPPFLDTWSKVNAQGSSGGIISCWDSRLFDLISESAGAFSLTVSLRDRRTDITWIITNIYGPSVASLKKDFWLELSLLGSALSPANWILCGDFNCTTSAHDRNKSHNTSKVSKSFNSFINNFNLYDIPIEGSKYTWTNLQAAPILVKLDRFLLSSSSWDLLPSSFCTSHPRFLSDHTPIQLSSERKKGPRKPFKLETTLLGNLQLDSIIRATWTNSSSLPIHLKLRKIKKQYKRWTRNNFKPIQEEKKKLLLKIQDLDPLEENLGSLSPVDLASRRQIKSNLADILDVEEKIWKTRSKAKWIKDGDKNTSYYHRVASMRQKLNFISKIKIYGSEISSPITIQEALMNHFKDQFSLPEPHSSPQINWSEVGCPTLTPHQEDALSSPFSLEEIQKAVWALPSDKSPGPDGLSIDFYKHFWDSIKNDIQSVLDDFWNNKLNLDPLNTSFISLIPKCEGALEIHDFRPISLQNSLMKIISKILAERMRGSLNHLIADCQSAYLRDRSILESFASAQEIIHSTKRLGSEGVLIKLDFAKAYDCISWPFLIQTLKARGFGPRWIKWISSILISSRSSVLVNGIPSKPFIINRGLRQGDPLSAYLFILVTDTLSRMLSKAYNNNLIGSISLNPASPNPFSISHLQFADDTIIFSRANPSSILMLKAIIHFFSLVSGLQINLSKTKLIGLNISDQETSSLADLFGCTCASLPIKYLGLPLKVSNLTRNDWNPLLAKLNSSLSSWKAQALSIPGRIVLLNSNLTALPVYFMSLFLLPSWLIHEIDKIRRNFLCSGPPSQPKRIHSVNWKTVCRPQREGGLGIKNLKTFNISLLLKWWWKLIFSPSLWSSIIMNKYYTKKHPLDLRTNPPIPSPMWKGILSLKNIFKASVSWSLGSGTCISFWHENWGPSLALRAEFPSLFSHALLPSSKVASNFNRSSNLWTPKFAGPLTLAAFSEHIKLTLLLSSFSIFASSDKPQCSWFPSKFSTKHAYQILSSSGIQWNHARIWKLQIPPKIRIFIWKILIGKINTKDILLRRNFPVLDPTCAFCTLPESIDHLFLNCPSLHPLWEKCCSPLSPEPLPSKVDSFWNDWFLSLSKPNQKLWNLWVPALSWAIWIERNNRCFSNSSADIQSLLGSAQGLLLQWNPNAAV